MNSHSDLAQHYQRLHLSAQATIEEIDAAYMTLSYQALRQGNKVELQAIKTAYRVLKAQLQQQAEQAEQNTPVSTPESQAVDCLVEQLRQLGWEAQIQIQAQQLHIGLSTSQVANPKLAVAKIYRLLEELGRSDRVLASVQTVNVYGLRAPKQADWRESFRFPHAGWSKDDRDLFSFNNRFSNTFVFPLLLFWGWLLGAVPLTQFLLRGIQIWIHEFGHATVAWLSGRRAIPLPFGWTNIQLNRSLFVYLGVLTLLGLWGWASHRERHRGATILAGILAVVQFYLTWWISSDTFEMLLAFGGIGGEFYLSTLLMVSFYFPMPAYWRWDFWRYPVAFAAAFTFWQSLRRWQQISSGEELIPWGTLWGGEGDAGGDMDVLSWQFGWSDQQIIDTYSFLGGVCLSALLGIYFYFLIKQNRTLWFAYWQRWRAR